MVSRWRTPLQVAASVVVVVSALIVSAVVFGTPQTEIDDRPVSEQFPYTCAGSSERVASLDECPGVTTTTVRRTTTTYDYESDYQSPYRYYTPPAYSPPTTSYDQWRLESNQREIERKQRELESRLDQQEFEQQQRESRERMNDIFDNEGCSTLYC